MRLLLFAYVMAAISLAQPAKELPPEMAILPGMTYAEVGLLGGSIDWAVAADAVGPYGKVQVVIFNRMLFDEPKPKRPNIHFTFGSVDDPKLAVASVDALLIHDFSARHQRSEKLLAFIRSALKPGGTLYISETFKWWDEDAYERQIEAAGFDILKRFDHGGFRWMSFRRP